MSKPHPTLRPGYNLVLIAVWGTVSVFLFFTITPRPFILVLSGAFLGYLGGLMQTLGFREAKETFFAASSFLDVRKSLKATKWGKRYLYFLWAANLAVIILSITFTSNPLFNALVGYFSLMFIREIVTLKPTFELDKLQRSVNNESA